ncbi:MAG: DegT/DnrJ/EryC1/StrS family aminotransferase [Nanoarchaeota archaeon]
MIKLADVKSSYLEHKEEIDSAIHRVLDSGWYILGKEVSSFEGEFASYIGTKYAVGVANGTDAIEIALRACELPPGSQVITVSNTVTATVAAIERAGLVPVFVDINPFTLTMDSTRIEEMLTFPDYRNVKAIVPVHLFGNPADAKDLIRIANKYGLKIIEDCAQAHGASIHGAFCGTFGDLGAFSFYPTKNLGAIGDGGAVVTSNKELYDKLIMLRQYGWKNRYESEMQGINSRLDEIQAAILRVKLKYLDSDNNKRITLAGLYNSLLCDRVVTPQCKFGHRHIYHLYVVQAEERDELRQHLKENNIESAIHYPVPVHSQKAYQWKYKYMYLPNTEEVKNKILSLPLHPYLSTNDVENISNIMKRFIEKRKIDKPVVQEIKSPIKYSFFATTGGSSRDLFSIESWNNMEGPFEIILFFPSRCKDVIFRMNLNTKFKLVEIPNGIPKINYLIKETNKIANGRYIVYVNGDIAMNNSVISSLDEAFRKNFDMAVCGRRQVPGEIKKWTKEDFDNYQQYEIYVICGIDLFAFKKGEFLDFPDFYIGYPRFDNYFIISGLNKKLKIVDITEKTILLHRIHTDDTRAQNKDYHKHNCYTFDCHNPQRNGYRNDCATL